jgi:thiamine-phosphate pyrophosphorylase
MMLSTTQHIARHKIQGIYAITPDLASSEQTLAEVNACLQGGIKILQFRNKQLPIEQQIILGKKLRQCCTQHQALLICNDSLQIAQAIQADGLHIGIDDGNLQDIRQQWQGILGISCYNDLHRAQTAYEFGADYVAFGAIFPSTTKPKASQANLSTLTQCQLPIPKVAIGGITLNNMGSVINAGADAIALISTIFEASNITLQAQQCKAQFNLHQPRHLN